MNWTGGVNYTIPALFWKEMPRIFPIPRMRKKRMVSVLCGCPRLTWIFVSRGRWGPPAVLAVIMKMIVICGESGRAMRLIMTIPAVCRALFPCRSLSFSVPTSIICPGRKQIATGSGHVFPTNPAPPCSPHPGQGRILNWNTATRKLTVAALLFSMRERERTSWKLCWTRKLVRWNCIPLPAMIFSGRNTWTGGWKATIIPWPV